MNYVNMKVKNVVKRLRIYAFIDSQNVNLGTNEDIYKDRKKIYSGWKLDFQKFRRYLKDKFRVDQAFLFIGYMPKYKKLYSALRRYGYILIFKPTVQDDHGKGKGNVDAEIVLYSAAVKYKEYDKAVFASGDGDFYCLYDFLEKAGKLLKVLIPNKYSESSLLAKFQEYKVFLYREKEALEFKTKKAGGVAI